VNHRAPGLTLFGAEEISMKWIADAPAATGLRQDSPCEINDINPSQGGAKGQSSASQQQFARIVGFFFHGAELIFNFMIICNIYHSAVRKIRL
jgi:hypothetical protein